MTAVKTLLEVIKKRGMALIIAVIADKGGPGKTTLLMLIAGTLGKLGLKVLVVDGNARQQSASYWKKMEDPDNPFPADVIPLGDHDTKIHQKIKKYLPEYDIILIDCPAVSDSTLGESILLVSDFAVVPFPALPIDMSSIIPYQKKIKKIQKKNINLKVRLAINKFMPETRLCRVFLEDIEEDRNKEEPKFLFPFFKSKIHSRIIYAEAPAFGCTIQDFGYRGKAATQEVEEMTHEIINLLT